MKNAAAISAQLVDVRNVGQHKCVKLTLHVPAEQAQQVMAAFGWPTMVDPVPVAVARLQSAAHSADEGEGVGPSTFAVDHSATPSASVRGRPSLAQHIGMMCNDPLFQKYIDTKYGQCSDSKEAASFVRTYCRVNSRSEIKFASPANVAWCHLESNFILWRDADKYIEGAA